MGLKLLAPQAYPGNLRIYFQIYGYAQRIYI